LRRHINEKLADEQQEKLDKEQEHDREMQGKKDKNLASSNNL